MVYVTDGRYHHCPGASGGSVGSKADELFGNCRFNKKPRYCSRHQTLCPKHPNWSHMKHLPCELCEEAERAQDRSVAILLASSSNIGSRELKGDKNVGVESDKMTSAENSADEIKRKDHGADARKKLRVDIVAQKLELFDKENTQQDALPLQPFEKRRRRAAEVIEKRGWEDIRGKLIEHGVGERSLPTVSPTGSPKR